MTDTWPSDEPLDPKTIQQLFAPTIADVDGVLGTIDSWLCECSHPLKIHEHRITYDPPPTAFTGTGRCWSTDCACQMYQSNRR